MANKKFSDLDTASTLTGVELFAVSQSSVSKKTLLSAVKTFLDSAVATLTNKTFDTAGTGNVFKIAGTTISANTGTGSNVLATSPTLTTPNIGVATGASLATTGNHSVTTAGSGLLVKEGSNAKQGVAVLVAGSVVVANTSVTASSRIFITSQVDGGTPGFVRVSARTPGTDFTITSSSGSDTSTIGFQIFEPA